MEDQGWQDKTDRTLHRIESQEDGTEIQEGFAKSFRETVLIALARIEDTLKLNQEFMAESRDDREQIRSCISKIPGIETGLNNHLEHHDKMMRYVMYPIVVAVILAGLGAFFKVVLHVF